MADGAVAADRGNALRGPTAEDGDPQRGLSARRGLRAGRGLRAKGGGQYALRFDDSFGGAGGLDEAEAQFVEHLFEHLTLLG